MGLPKTLSGPQVGYKPYIPSPRPDPVSSWVGRSTGGSAPSVGGTIARGVGLGLFAAPVIVDLIGRAGAYKWRDNLINQVNGGNSNKIAGPPPFRGGQTPYAIYIVEVTGFIDAPFSPNQHFIAYRPTISGFGPISDIRVDYVPPSEVDSRHQWRLVVQFSNYTYRGGIYGLNGAQDISQFTWGVEDIVIRRADGGNDTGGDLQGAISGQDNPNPFASPFVEPSPSPNPFPNPSPNPFSGPPPNPSPSPPPIPAPSPSRFPFSNPSPNPFPNPFPNPSPNPFPNPSPNPFPNPSPNPSPSPVIIPPPNIDLGKLIDGQREVNSKRDQVSREAEQIKGKIAIQDNAAKKAAKDAVCEEAQPDKCIDRAIKRNNQNPESVSITVKEFDKCGDDGKPVFKTKSINVPKGSEAYITNLFEEIADTAGLSCSINVVATFPDSWAGKVPDDRPQAVVYYREWNGSKFGDYKCHVSIPHYSKPKGFKPSLPTIKKGSFFGILKLKDNSQIYVNCESTNEAKRVVTSLRQFTGVQGKGAKAKYGEYGDGDLKKVTVKPVRLDFYSKGTANATPDWSVYL